MNTVTLADLKDRVPDYAKDIRLNIGTLIDDETLTPQQKWGCFTASALACGNADVIQATRTSAQAALSPAAWNAACTAASLMAMNNIYYRFVHLSSNADYHAMPAKLRMNALANPGVDKTDFELWSLAVSAINGCGMCIDAHEKQLVQHGVSTASIQTAVRIAAVVHALARVLDADAALSCATAQDTHSIASAA